MQTGVILSEAKDLLSPRRAPISIHEIALIQRISRAPKTLTGPQLSCHPESRSHTLPNRTRLTLRLAAALPLLASGVLHLLRPRLYLPLVPPPFPPQPWFIVLTGLPELLGAAGLLVPRTRRAAALCLSVYLVAIFPANVHVAGQRIHGLRMPGVPVRAAMQAAYILLILIAGARPKTGLPG